jgi:hypothetical protein
VYYSGNTHVASNYKKPSSNLKDSKSLFLYLIPYMTFCGALYHVTFWDRFDINGLAFISLSDILKSAVYPIFSILLSVVYNLTVQNLILPSSADNTVKPVFKKGISNTKLLIFYLIITTLATLIFYLTNTIKDPTNYVFYGGLNAIAISIFMVNSGFLAGQFTSERMRRLVIDLIVFIPIVSYYTGKYRSEQVYQNLKYKYSIKTNINPTTSLTTSSYSLDTLKFVGNTDKHFVFTDLKNSKILFVKSDIVDTLILYDKK